MKYFLRQAGFEPAHPEITRLKLVVLDRSTIDAKRNFSHFYYYRHSEKKTSYIYNILQLLILKIVKISERVYAKNNSSVMPVGLSHLNA